MTLRRVSTGWLALACMAGLAGCAATPSRVDHRLAATSLLTGSRVLSARPAEPPTTSRSFFVRGQRYPIGQAALLRVCVTPDGAISTVEIMRSSGEAGFDEFAMVWARQADVSAWVSQDDAKTAKGEAPKPDAGKGEPQESCGSVRVEIGHGRRQRSEQGADTALG